MPISVKNSRAALLWAIPLVIVGMLAREIIAIITWGSWDATYFQEFGRQIALHGILHIYRTTDFNHPPLMGYAMAFVYRLTHSRLDIADTKAMHHIGWTFPFVFKQFNILADGIACWLIWKVLRRRCGADYAALASALFAICPLSVVQSGYHGNDDHIYAMLCLLSVYLIEDKGRDFAGGLALAAAINVKLIPVLLILPMLMRYRDWPRARWFLAGVSLGVIPFLPIMIMEPALFARNVLQYASAVGNWGIHQILQDARREPRFAVVAQSLIEMYYTRGRWIIIAAIVLLALRARRKPDLDRYSLAACTLCLFLIIAPGFGIHYLVIPLPLLFVRKRLVAASMYGLLAGILCFLTAWQNWYGSWPIEADTIIGPVAPGPLFGLLAWATLIVFAFGELRRPEEQRVD